MPVNDFGVCPDECNATLQLPALPVDQNCIAYDNLLSQINDLWIKPDGVSETPFSGWATGTVTANPTAINNADVANTAVKWLVGEGGLPAAAKVVTDYPKSRKKTTKRTYTITYTVKNVSSDQQYAFGQTLQCGDTSFTFWYATADHVFGDENGIAAESIDCDFVYGAGADDTVNMVITITYVAKTDPDRRNNPYQLS